MRKIFFICLGLILFLSSCKNDLELNAPWKDITIVYGLLNSKDNIQYLKINKAYLGEGNALIMAKIPDSSSYFNNLDVKVEEWKNGLLTKTIVFDTTTVYNKEPGTFYYPDQIIYKSNVRLDSVNKNVVYKLKITNKLTGKIISAKTKLAHDFFIVKPVRNHLYPLISFASKDPSTVELNVDTSYHCRYFQVNFRFHYVEQDTITMNVSNKSLDLYVGDAIYDDINSQIILSYLGRSFYSMLKSKIPVSPNIVRKPKQNFAIELIVYAANDEFYTYMQAVKPSSGIVQDKPEYTNIENGIGIFASRFYLINTYNLNPASLDSLCFGSYTKDLGFQKN
jgi:hypothetical protein